MNVSSRRDPFPIEAARDLLGLVRSLYAAAKQRDAGKRHLARLAAAGRALSAAIELAQSSAPGSPEHARAWDKAERATAELGMLVDVYASVLPTVEAATLRVLHPERARKFEASKIERRRTRG